MLTADPLRFFAALLRSPASIGAVAPSSAALARRMVGDLDLSDGRAIVELGPGTGPFTRAIEPMLDDPARYLGIERNAGFVRLLAQRHPRMRIAHGSAEHLIDHVEQAGLGPSGVGVILCGLPFASLPAAAADAVIDSLDRLMTAGTLFRTFQYVHAWPMPAAIRFRRLMRHRFGPPRISRPVLRNLPPALVLSWRRPDTAGRSHVDGQDARPTEERA